MSAPRGVATFLMLSMIASGPGFAGAVDNASLGAPPPGPVGPPAPASATEFTAITPARVSYISGEASFWRPGAQDWAPASLNTPLAPGDVLYSGQDGTVEVQVGPSAFVRAGNDTQIGLDNHEPDFLQLRVTAGTVALDLRSLAAGHTVELDTPNAAFTIERMGYYHVDVAQDATTFRVHRGGSAMVTPASGPATPIAANQRIVVTGTDSPRVEMGPAGELSAWDRWNSQRTDHLLQATSVRYVAPGVYGTEALAQHGSWRSIEPYGPVWMPADVPAGWVPYSTGRWIWDPRFGWTWLDDAPWGWAPYHYGRWIFVGDAWAWAPGPIVVRPAYAPALVVFLGGGAIAGVGRPVCWAPLGWGEPLIPWWGRPGFIGKAWWGGWAGPRVVNNVVVNRTTNINVTNITVYKNVNVTNAVVGVPAHRFGHGPIRPARIHQSEVRQLTPVRGALAVKPVAASLTPATGPAVKPLAAIHERAVVATRAPHDLAPTLRTHGLAAPAARAAAAPRLVPSPRTATTPASETVRPGGPHAPADSERRRGDGAQRPAVVTPPGGPKMATPPPGAAAPPPATTRDRGKNDSRPRAETDQAQPPSPPPPWHPVPRATTSRQTPSQPPAAPSSASEGGRREDRPEPRAHRPPAVPAPRAQSPHGAPERAPDAAPSARPERPAARVERPERSEPPAHSGRPQRVEPPARSQPQRFEPPARSEPQRGESPARVQRPERVEPPVRNERLEPAQPPARSERLERAQPPARVERFERVVPPAGSERSERIEPPARERSARFDQRSDRRSSELSRARPAAARIGEPARSAAAPHAGPVSTVRTKPVSGDPVNDPARLPRSDALSGRPRPR